MVDDEIIKRDSLEKALVHAKFYNGESAFKDEKEKRIISELLRDSERNLQGKEGTEKLAKYFLERRRTVNDRYHGSSLEKIYKRLHSVIDPNFEE